MWITTDLWENDAQLNCYNSKGTWLWELTAQDMSKKLPPIEGDLRYYEPMTPGIGWARADRTGARWLVSVGLNWKTACGLVDLEGHFQSLPNDCDIWDRIFPRAMGVRRNYTSLKITSDDGERTINRSEQSHGVGVGWPSFGFAYRKQKIFIHNGDWHFGFWPNSHKQVYVEQENYNEKTSRIFFYQDWLYQGEVDGKFLADAVAGGLLIRNSQDEVIRVIETRHGVQAVGRFKFTLNDSTQPIIPLALYDDLKLGFFQKENELFVAKS